MNTKQMSAILGVFFSWILLLNGFKLFYATFCVTLISGEPEELYRNNGVSVEMKGELLLAGGAAFMLTTTGTTVNLDFLGVRSYTEIMPFTGEYLNGATVVVEGTVLAERDRTYGNLGNDATAILLRTKVLWGPLEMGALCVGLIGVTCSALWWRRENRAIKQVPMKQTPD